ncbi:tRNA glutamyl-Q(34) synthetase GluQRS [Isosphaeraceae bacterium EP7]
MTTEPDLDPAAARIRGRLAPSPTGGLHLGHARTFLVAWLAARSAGGTIVLRIEDLDRTRVRPDVIPGILEDLRWLGLHWNEGPDVGGPHAPYLQSARESLYRGAIEHLRRLELVYPCTCTRAEIARAASAPHPGEEGAPYPGTCAGRSAEEADSLGGKPYAWRFRVSDEPVVWDDAILGPVSMNPTASGDFIVGRSDGLISYQLAVVVDDAAMRINQVIRGDDLLPSTPRQILLYRALGRDLPRFGHVPLTFGRDGRRLAKRDASIKLTTLRQRGVSPESLVGRVIRSCGWSDSDFPSVPIDWIGHAPLDALFGRTWMVEDEFA